MEGAVASNVSFPVAILIVVGAAAAGFVAVALLRRVVGSVLVHPVRGTSMPIVAGTSFAVLLAFLILSASQTYSTAKTGAATEANAVLQMSRDADLFPASQRDQLRSDFTCYGRAVVNYEWPAMSHGQSSPLVDHWIGAYRSEFRRLADRTPREQAAFQDLLTLAATRTTGRQARLADDTSAVPWPLWVGLIFVGCVAVSLQLGMVNREERLFVQGLQVGGLAAIVAASLLMVNFLDHPYSSTSGIKPRSMLHTLAQLNNIDPSLRLACTESGRPS